MRFMQLSVIIKRKKKKKKLFLGKFFTATSSNSYITHRPDIYPLDICIFSFKFIVATQLISPRKHHFQTSRQFYSTVERDIRVINKTSITAAPAFQCYTYDATQLYKNATERVVKIVALCNETGNSIKQRGSISFLRVFTFTTFLYPRQRLKYATLQRWRTRGYAQCTPAPNIYGER